MSLPDHIHITGGSGSGTSTLGAAIAAAHGHTHLDTDDFYWLPVDPPYTFPRPAGERAELLKAALDRHPRWVLSGAIGSWAYQFAERFDLVIWLTPPREERLRRLTCREALEFGPRIAEGGDMRETYLEFIEWAGRYDDGDTTMRSHARHAEWTAGLGCQVIRIDGIHGVEGLVRHVENLSEQRSADPEGAGK